MVKSDHYNLILIPHSKRSKWKVEKVGDWDSSIEFDIEYVKDKKNVVSDYLSRRPSNSLMDVA